MKLAALLLLSVMGAQAADKPPLTDADAADLISTGHCGSASGEKGTGMGAHSGWVVSPYPAEICVAGDGGLQTIGMQTVKRCIRIEQFGGPPVYVNVFSSEPKKLEWKVDGYQRSAMPPGFQFPPMGPGAK